MILSASGWRDIFAVDGNEESMCKDISPKHKTFAVTSAKVFADYLLDLNITQKPINVVVGMDTRPTGPLIADYVIRGLVNAGCNVSFAGVTAAPEIMAFTSLAGRYENASEPKNIAGFIFISASHNPAGHNGIKFGLTDGGVLDATQAKKLIESFCKIFDNEKLSKSLLSQSEKVDANILARIYERSTEIKQLALKYYYDFTDQIVFESLTANHKHQNQAIGICADLNGSARCSSIDKKYFEEHGIKFAAINDTAGNIAHKIVPEDDALIPCCRFLEEMHSKNNDFVLGYVPDCDGDRGNLVIWDELKNAARALEAQEVFALAVLAELAFCVWCGKTENMAVAVNDPTSMRVDHICAAFGANLYRAEVGEANVVSLGRKLRGEGNLVRILGEGSAGGNITHPSSVRDPIDTVMSIVKLLTIRSGLHGKENKMGLFEIWCERSGQRKKYKTDFTLADIISTMPKFYTTGTYSEDAVLKINIKDHVEFKRNYQIIFIEDWQEKKTMLNKIFGITDWCAAAYNGIVESDDIADFGIADKGGLKIYFLAEDRYIAAIWMRGSATEPVFRIMADAEGDENLERFLIKWQRDLVEKSVLI
ncbi:phosphoglucomutase [Spirochaetia bacterium]|nr:phosphoglucomutase [Spirochaetia bacterium]